MPIKSKKPSNSGRAGVVANALVGADFVMPFGKYKGRTLDDISDHDPGYVVWLADEGVLKIEKPFMDAVRRDDMEMDYIDPSDRCSAFRDD